MYYTFYNLLVMQKQITKQAIGFFKLIPFDKIRIVQIERKELTKTIPIVGFK